MSDGSSDALATSDTDVSDGSWHSVTMEKNGRVLGLTVDGRVSVVSTAPEGRINTNTPLYIGGIPG